MNNHLPCPFCGTLPRLQSNGLISHRSAGCPISTLSLHPGQWRMRVSPDYPGHEKGLDIPPEPAHSLVLQGGTEGEEIPMKTPEEALRKYFDRSYTFVANASDINSALPMGWYCTQSKSNMIRSAVVSRTDPDGDLKYYPMVYQTGDDGDGTSIDTIPGWDTPEIAAKWANDTARLDAAEMLHFRPDIVLTPMA